MTTAGEFHWTPAIAHRTVTDLMRRGLDSAIANWQLLLLRGGESILIGLLTIGTAVAVIIPLLVSIGISRINADNPDTAAEILRAAIFEHWMIIIYVLVAISVALLVMMVIHSFVMAGAARIFLNAERAAGRGEVVRQRFGVFSMEQWMAGGRDAWWRVFWIYNIAYGVAGIIVMLPLLPLAGVIIIFQAAPAAIVLSCLGLIVGAFATILVLVVTGIVCQKAIIVVARKPVDATEALRLAWRAMRADFSRHFAIAFIMYVLTFGGGGAVAMISLAFTAPSAAVPLVGLLFMPLRLSLSLAGSIFSAAVSNWFLASFAALTVEEG